MDGRLLAVGGANVGALARSGEGVEEPVDRGEAASGPLVEGAEERRLGRGRDPKRGVYPTQRRRLLEPLHHQDLGERPGEERPPGGDHVEEGGEGVDVGGGVEAPARDLLRGGRRRAAGPEVVAREADVAQRDRAARVDPHRRRSQAAEGEAAAVEPREPPTERRRERQRLVPGEAAAAIEVGCEALAAQLGAEGEGVLAVGHDRAAVHPGDGCVADRSRRLFARRDRCGRGELWPQDQRLAGRALGIRRGEAPTLVLFRERAIESHAEEARGRARRSDLHVSTIPSNRRGRSSGA
ncbi:MAG: hypothetical protein R3A79_03335 [Nannocystaceae bacterium]